MESVLHENLGLHAAGEASEGPLILQNMSPMLLHPRHLILQGDKPSLDFEGIMYHKILNNLLSYLFWLGPRVRLDSAAGPAIVHAALALNPYAPVDPVMLEVPVPSEMLLWVAGKPA